MVIPRSQVRILKPDTETRHWNQTLFPQTLFPQTLTVALRGGAVLENVLNRCLGSMPRLRPPARTNLTNTWFRMLLCVAGFRLTAIGYCVSMSNGEVHRRVVAVTGASGGVGRAVVREFAKRGDSIALLSRGEVGLAATAGEVTAAGATPMVVPVDVADPFQIEAAVARIENELGPIDIWVNSAFTSIFAPFAEISPEEFKRVTEVTYLGAVYATMAVLRRMRERDAGTIVHVGLDAGVPRDSAAERVLRRKTCTARFP